MKLRNHHHIIALTFLSTGLLCTARSAAIAGQRFRNSTTAQVHEAIKEGKKADLRYQAKVDNLKLWVHFAFEGRQVTMRIDKWSSAGKHIDMREVRGVVVDGRHGVESDGSYGLWFSDLKNSETKAKSESSESMDDIVGAALGNSRAQLEGHEHYLNISDATTGLGDRGRYNPGQSTITFRNPNLGYASKHPFLKQWHLINLNEAQVDEARSENTNR